MKHFLKIIGAMLGFFGIFYFAPSSPMIATAIFLIGILLFLSSKWKEYRLFFRRGVTLKTAWNSEIFGAVVFKTIGGLAVFVAGFAVIMMVAAENRSKIRAEDREIAQVANIRANASKVCPAIAAKYPNGLSDFIRDFKEENKDYAEAVLNEMIGEATDSVRDSFSQCESYGEFGEEWKRKTAENDMRCIGWVAGKRKDDAYSWCRYYNNTPPRLNPEQVAAYEAYKASDFTVIPKQFDTAIQYDAKEAGQPVESTEPEAPAAAPATGDDLWK